MEEKSVNGSQPLLPTHEQRRQFRMEEASLMSLKTSERDAWATDRIAFLVGFNLLSSGANLYMFIQNLDSGAGWYYLVSLLGGLLGLYGVAKLNPTVIFLFSCYLAASFLFSSVIAGGALFIVMRKNVCSSVFEITQSREVRDFCLANTTSFRALALGAIFGELLIELFIIYQLKKVHQVAVGREKERYLMGKPGKKPKLGSIAIIEP